MTDDSHSSVSARQDWKVGLFPVFVEFAALSAAALRKAPVSIGYEPWLIEKGCPPGLARLLADLIVRHGRRVAADRAREPAAVESLRVMCDPTAGYRAKQRRVAVLLRAWEETHILETIFDHAGVDVCHFAEELKCVHRCSSDFRVVTEMARIAVDNWRPRRGRMVTAASAAHKFFLETVVPDFGGARAYTRDPIEDDFVDPCTKATRLEFTQPRFNPQSARRRQVRGNLPFEPQ